jgi:hypothetical protein
VEEGYMVLVEEGYMIVVVELLEEENMVLVVG